MKWANEGKWITVSFGLVLILVGFVSVSSYQNATQLMNSANQVKETNEILNSLTDISAFVADAESSRWSYLIFNDLQELERYSAAIAQIPPILDQLEEPLSDTPVQEERLQQLRQLIEQRTMLFERSIQQYDGNLGAIASDDPIMIQTRENQARIQQLIEALEREEESLLQEQVEQVRSDFQFRMILEPLGTLLTFAILVMVYGMLLRQTVKRQRAEALQRQLAQQKELSEMKLQFFSMVSHEFRTPLSLIMGSAQLLDETLKPLVDAAKLKNLYRIQSSARSMTRLLNDVLMLARADAGKLEFRPEVVEVQTFCLNLIEDCQVFSRTPRSIQFLQHGSCTHAMVDEKLLYSILSNLLSNAMKYSDPDSTIVFVLKAEPEVLIFEIQDSGIGILPEDQARLYDLFTRGRNAREIRGTGLGLAVVKTCVDLHHGHIEVHSQVGVGTTFTVSIPQPYRPVIPSSSVSEVP
jgi:signal transduction histidine kinase